MTLVALISNPRSTGNRSLLPAIRNYCANSPEIFHYEVEEVDQIAEAFTAGQPDFVPVSAAAALVVLAACGGAVAWLAGNRDAHAASPHHPTGT